MQNHTSVYSTELQGGTCRLTGRAVFRRNLLSRAGILIEVPIEVLKQDASQLANYLERQIESVAEGGLDAYHHSRPIDPSWPTAPS